MFVFKAVEDPANRETVVKWYLAMNGEELAFSDGPYKWNKHGRQGAWQVAQARIRELHNAHSRSKSA